jgi:predicted signal transduction protein with EAL and GGDEF domain
MPIVTNMVSGPDQTERQDDTAAILSTIGEVAYRWTLEGDRLEWGGDALALLGLDSAESIATGQAFAQLLDDASPLSRDESLLIGTDNGDGVAYQIEYALRPAGPRGPILWIEDTGRWYADGGEAARRAEGVLRVINERHAREQRLAFLSRYDDVTGLYNRSALLDILDQTLTDAREQRSSAAFLLVAIDDFRLINDAYGYRAGDRVLAAVAR